MSFQRGLLLFATGIGLVSGLPACGHVEVQKTCGNGSATSPIELPDPSFEDSPSAWTLGSHSTIDDTISHDGTRALRVELDHGLGSEEVTRSGAFTGLELDTEYEVCFYYRFQHGNKARYTVHVGDYEQTVAVDGDKSGWTQTSLVVSFSKDPSWIDITASRMGAAGDFASSDYDDNLFWIDDIEVGPN